MTWQIYPIEQFQQQAAEWNALQQAAAGMPFQESAFLLPLLAEFGSGRELLAFYRQFGELQAAAIIAPGRLGMWETFQPSQLPLGAWLSLPDLDLASRVPALISALPHLALGLGITQLDPLLQIRPTHSQRIRTQDYIETAWVEVNTDFETYWESRGKNIKQNARKQRNKLQTEGVVVRLECVTAPHQVADAIADYGRLESAGWKAANGTAVHPDNAQGRFYRQMLENFCAMGRGRIYRYYFGDKVVSMDLCIDNGSTMVILKTAYDESYKSISPSSLMRQDEFCELFSERKFQRIEFYGKVMEWHTRWTENKRTIYHATAYRWAILKEIHARISRMRQAEKPRAVLEQA